MPRTPTQTSDRARARANRPDSITRRKPATSPCARLTCRAVLIGKRMMRSTCILCSALRDALLDLAALTSPVPKESSLKISQTRRFLPLFQRSNNLFVAIPTRQPAGADEMRFKGPTWCRGIVVETKSWAGVVQIIAATGRREDMSTRGHGVGLEDGAPAISLDETPTSRRTGRQVPA